MSIKIFGAGLAAYAVKLALPTSKVFANKAVCKHFKINSEWRENPIIYNLSTHGLSGYYHGVTPINLFYKSENKTPLNYLNIWFPTNKIKIHHGYFVPLKVPRPKIDDFESFKSIDFKNTEIIFLCLSVIGNLQYLIEKGYLADAIVGDDLVYKIGTISTGDYLKVLKNKAIRVKTGSVFPVLKFKRKVISFRPIFIKETNLNFIDLNKNFSVKNISFIDFIEKILSALYLRFGLVFFPIKKWACYVQDYIDNAYTINATNVKETEFLKKNYEKSKNETMEFLRKKFDNFIEEDGFIISGIHLRYDRSILNGIPSNIHLIDNSLSLSYGEHPTIEMFCNAYNYAFELTTNHNARYEI
jgi:hypothetical protein